MNKDLKEALAKQKFKIKIKSLISENRLEEQDLYTTFVEPFADAVKAANLATQDVISGVMVILGTTLLSFSPKLQQARLDNFDKRYEAIGKEWEPLMSKADEALGAGDADLLAMIYAPGIYALSALGASSYNSAEGIGTFLSNLGIKQGFLSLLPGVSSASLDTTTSSLPDSSDDKTPLIDKMFMLFLGGAAVGEYIKYQEKQEKKSTDKNEATNTSQTLISENKQGDFLEDFREFLKSTGVSSEMESAQEKMQSAYEDIIEGYDKEVSAKESVIDAISEATDADQFVKKLAGIESSGIDLQGAPQTLRKEIENGALKLSQSKDFRDKIEDLSSQGNEPESQVSESEILDSAKKAVFEDMKKNFLESSDKKVLKMKRSLGKDLEKRLPSEKALSIISKTPAGLKLSKLIQDAKTRYINI
jgi:hypothetical protein